MIKLISLYGFNYLFNCFRFVDFPWFCILSYIFIVSLIPNNEIRIVHPHIAVIPTLFLSPSHPNCMASRGNGESVQSTSPYGAAALSPRLRPPPWDLRGGSLQTELRFRSFTGCTFESDRYPHVYRSILVQRKSYKFESLYLYEQPASILLVQASVHTAKNKLSKHAQEKGLDLAGFRKTCASVKTKQLFELDPYTYFLGKVRNVYLISSFGPKHLTICYFSSTIICN